MKKLAIRAAAILLLLGVAATGAYAAGGAGYTDENSDGVCDYYAAGRGANFTDENSDGVCDRYAGGCRRQAGRRAGRGGNF